MYVQLGSVRDVTPVDSSSTNGGQELTGRGFCLLSPQQQVLDSTINS